ncbi:hypothetical protein C2S52_019230 [Perilla frutescens var. hirtella]|nr:hypothetical protein C2S52_019230 [Perilla frutescens var. hirtella]KAH6806479.1 hypothetical protein C2S51_031310 [Perilla frutescens var. frutescens]
MEMATPSTAGDGGQTGGFECNICFGLAQDPVITRCGHLHCWPCLYEWLRFHSQSHECPVCKAVIKEEELIPLYGRGNTTLIHQGLIPRRPAGQRPATAPPPPPNGGGLLRRRSGFGVPTVLSVRFREIGGGGGYGSFGEGGGNGESGVVEEGNLDDNMKKILFLILAFLVFDFLII